MATRATGRGSSQAVATPQALMEVEVAAKYLAINRTRLYSLLGRGDIRSVKLGRRRLIPRTELDAFVERELEAQNAG